VDLRRTSLRALFALSDDNGGQLSVLVAGKVCGKSQGLAPVKKTYSLHRIRCSVPRQHASNNSWSVFRTNVTYDTQRLKLSASLSKRTKIKSNQTDYFIVRLKLTRELANLVCRTWEYTVTKTEKNRTKT